MGREAARAPESRSEEEETAEAVFRVQSLEEKPEEAKEERLMPPKVRRPAGVIRGAPKAKARVRGAGILRRPARAGEAEERGEVDISEALKAGSEVATCAVPLQEWRTGLRLHLTEASYWEEPASAVGVVKGLQAEGDQVILKFKMEGTQCEGLVKWAGAHPGQLAEVHLCTVDCAKLAKDGLIHAVKAKVLRAEEKKDWMDNLEGVGERLAEQDDELRRLREKAKEREKGLLPGEKHKPAEKVGSSDSSESRRKKKKKKKKKKEEEKADKTDRRGPAVKDLTMVSQGPHWIHHLMRFDRQKLR